jgi:hypothetical protein
MQIRKLATLALLSSCLFPACAKKQSKPDSESQAQDTASATASSTDPLMQEMLDVVQGCKVNPEHSVISQCDDSQKQDLIRDFRRGKRDKMSALPVLVQALEDDDPKLQTVAARIFEGAYRASFGDVKPGAVDKDIAKRLIAVFPNLGRRQQNQVVGAVVHAAVLSGEGDALFKMLDGLQDKALRAVAYSHLMVHGGAPELLKVEALAKGDDPTMVASALQAARNYKGDDAALKARVCALGEGKVTDKDAIVSMRAAQILVRCDEPMVDKLLDELERRDKEGQLTTGLVRSLYELCQVRKDQRQGTDAQCSRVRSSLEKWIADKKLAPEMRAAALFEIGVQFPDEKTEALCHKYENDSDLRVKTAAKESVRRVQRKLGKQVVNVGAPAGSGPGHHGPPLPSAVHRMPMAPGRNKGPMPPPPHPPAPSPSH